MSDAAQKNWVLPASVPFSELKRSDLEECVYWLLDAMGAKDLEWRTGGKGDGTADGGRDLEARFFTPSVDGELESQKWWIECKGRKGTVEPDAVKSAVNNSSAIEGLDCLVIATNSRFSNPTKDWVAEWQKKHPRPKVKLWDHTQLERYLSRHPDVVLRLFSQALSPQGQFQAMESRFWNKIEFVSPNAMARLWNGRADLDLSALGLFAAVANEFAQGSIVQRPWGAVLDIESAAQVLMLGLNNVPYLMMRCSSAGIDQKILFRAYAYLILVLLDALPAKNVSQLVMDSLNRSETDRFPDNVQAVLLMPIIDQLLSEMQDVCSSDCKRMMMLDRNTLTEDKDEVEDYWLRLEKTGVEDEQAQRRILRIEKNDAPCNVGFKTDAEHGCPLFAIEPTIRNTEELFAVIEKVAAFRKAQAAQKRLSKK